jgi:outer membrane protein assembly factor BamD
VNGSIRWLAALLVAFPLVAAAQAGMGGMGSPGASQRPSGGRNEDILPDVDEEIGADAQKSFAHAEEAFKNEEFLEAIAYYQHIRTKFSFNVPLAAKSELRLGDIAFKRERWLEARSYYRTFLRFHPKHEQADYAAFQAGRCTYREIPEDFFLFPPSTEKDQSDVRAALVQMNEFVRTHPQSKYVEEAKKLVADCESRLAKHELYVAKFYAAKEKWRGTVLRTDGLLRNYPESPEAPEALVLSVQAHVELGQADLAKASLNRLVALKADPKYLARAEQYAQKLK